MISDFDKVLAEMKEAAEQYDNKNYKCDYCNDSGWVKTYTDENGNDFYGECPHCGLIDKLRRNSSLKFANIPEIYQKNKIEDFKTTIYSTKENQAKAAEIMRIVTYWLDSLEEQKKAGRGLYLYSKDKGSGKTFLITSIANLLLSTGHEVKFATSIDIINEIKKTWEKKSRPENTEREGELLKQLSECEVLIIDDFGTEKVKDWISERFYSIINTRYNNRKITCYTSNVALKDLDYDERITSRLKATVYSIEFPSEDIRTMIGRKAHYDLYKNK